uniref:Uncharacterized protein n=1 Tax=Opuntia streptacantha TaxID=393608 RepID=A0A7C9ACA2_OPUST
MELIRECSPVYAFSAESSSSWITALNEETLDDSMEDGVVIVTLKAKLNEISHCFGSFLRPKLDVKGSVGGVNDHLPLRRRLQYVHRRHLAGLTPINLILKTSKKIEEAGSLTN